MQIKSKTSFALILLATFGFLDSLFLSIERFRGVIPPCTPGFKCAVVTTSEYSALFGIPLSYLGLIYYLILFIGAFVLYENYSKEKLNIVTLISGIGFFGSLWFTYIQAFILNAWCLYCILSALATTAFFSISLYKQKTRPV